jgi:hypothetical protein
MLAMGGIPVAAIENANHVVAHVGKGLEEFDESMFIIDLLFFGIVSPVRREAFGKQRMVDANL